MKIKNPKVVLYSLIAIACIFLAVFIHWLFIIPAVALLIINQKELMKKKKN